MLTDKSILKLCKRATKRNPKGVHIFDAFGGKTRYFESNRGVMRCTEHNGDWDLESVPYVGF